MLKALWSSSSGWELLVSEADLVKTRQVVFLFWSLSAAAQVTIAASRARLQASLHRKARSAAAAITAWAFTRGN